MEMKVENFNWRKLRGLILNTHKPELPQLRVYRSLAKAGRPYVQPEAHRDTPTYFVLNRLRLVR